MEIARVHGLSESQAKSMSNEDHKVNALGKKKPWKQQYKTPSYKQPQQPKTVRLPPEQLKTYVVGVVSQITIKSVQQWENTAKNAQAKIILQKCVDQRKKAYISLNKMTVTVTMSYL